MGKAQGNQLDCVAGKEPYDMRFIIDKPARRAYLFADTAIEEISLKQIYAHVKASMPNTVRFVESQTEKGLQTIAAHIEFRDSGARFGSG